MATLVLQAAGAAIGSLFGPLGAIAGRALGGLAGYTVDQALFGSRRTVEGSRLSDLSPQTSNEGTAIPRVYGRARISGQVIWATRFEEVLADARSGGKGGAGGTTTRTYSYFANFAIGLCAGPIARIGRVWADGQPFDLSTVTCRLYPGDAAQGVDSLIEAKQGAAPAYRDTAIVVFERLALEDFGNRIPQLSFEIIRPVAGIEGPNQPNVFSDPKSSASALPYYSSGLRDDLVQRRFIAAVLGYWNPASPDYSAGANPTSNVYGAPMVDIDAIHLWTWDARPFPAFPLLLDVWSDGANWETGHWLNGRLGALTADALVATVLADYGVPDGVVDDLDGTVDGFLIGDVISARSALEPLADLLLFEAFESGDTFKVVRRGRRAKVTFTADDLVAENGKPILTIKRAQETDLPAEISIAFADGLADYRPSSVSSRRLVGGSTRVAATDTGAVLSYAVASGLADTRLQDLWAGRETISLALPQRALALEPADVCVLDVDGNPRTILVTKVEDAGLRRIEARSIEPDILAAVPAAARALAPRAVSLISAPEVMLLDLPLLTGGEPGYAPRVAMFAVPWPGAIALSVGTAESGYTPRQTIARRAVIGELTASLPAGPVNRWDRGDSLAVRLYGGAVAGGPELAVLNGTNAAAIGTAATGFEIIQFETATLTGNQHLAADRAAARAGGDSRHHGRWPRHRRALRAARRGGRATGPDRGGIRARLDAPLRRGGCGL